MDIIERHRTAFSEIGSQLFGDLEKYLESVLKKGVEEQVEQEKVIRILKGRLDGQGLLLDVHEKSKLEYLKKIAEQKDEIHHLKCELAEALVENANLEDRLAPKVKSGRGRRRRALGTPPRELLEGKENLTPLPSALSLASPPQRLPTLERAVSPPLKSSIQTSISSNIAGGRGVQTEDLYSNDQATQTSPIHGHENFAEAYHELTTRYDSVRSETLKLKNAYLELQEKYIKNKKVWEAWIKTDKERIEKSKKRKREGTMVPEDGGRQCLDGNTTSITPTMSKTPYTKPPSLSPNKPILIPGTSHAIPMKPSIFAKSRGSIGKTGSEDLGVDVKTSSGTKVTQKGLLSSMEGARSELTESNEKPPSLPAALGAGAEAPTATRESPKSTPAAITQDHASDTESDSGESPDINTTPTQKLYDRPRPNMVSNVPKAGGEKDNRCTEGGSISDPVMIKSESSTASSEGFGYHLYEQESLDLDDIGHKPDTPRKRQRTANPLPREGPTSSTNSSGRPGWINGGFTVNRIPGAPQTQDPTTVEDTQDEDEGIMWNNQDDALFQEPSSSPMHPVGVFYQRKSRVPPGIASTKSTVPAHKSPDTSKNEAGTSPPPTESVNKPSLSTPVRRVTASDKGRSGRGISEKPKAKRRVAARDSIAQITEDGTSGVDDIETSDISEEQKKLEGIPKLSEMLHSPRTPSLSHLEKTARTWDSAPPKNTRRKEPEISGSTSEPPNRKAQKNWVDAIGYPKEKQKSCSRQTKLDISHFRVNPRVNDGRDYAFAETVRNREARKCLPGCAKSCCKGLSGFVEVAGLPSSPPKGPRWRSSSPASTDAVCDEGEVALDAKFTAKFGRHRDAFPRRKSPPGFWNADFPDTQDLERQYEAAEEMRVQKVEEMRREAEKGGKGRYIYKDR